MGMFTFTFSLSFVIGPLLGSWMYSNLGNGLWWAIISIGLIILPGLYVINKMLKKESLTSETSILKASI